MSKAYLRANVEVVLDGEPYRLEHQCSDGIWVLRHQRTGRSLERSTDDLFDAYAEETLVFKGAELRNISTFKRRGQAGRTQAVAAASSTETQKAKERMAYVRAVIGLPYTQNRIEQAIDEVWQKLKANSGPKPSWSSVYRWSRAYLESGETPASLLSATSSKGNRESRYSSEVIDICEEVIDSVYLTLERPAVEHVLNLAKAKTRAANAMLPKPCQLKSPTRRLIQRLIDRIPAYDRHAARYGRESARNKYRNVRNHRLTDAPLQRAEMDHTRMDLFVVDDTHGIPLGRPWLTILIDDYTRCILGYCLSFEPPSRATVARCLRHAFMPKIKLREAYPDLKNSWFAFGVVSELVLDGGPEFYSEDLENICFELNIEQHFSPRKTPWFKGKVERFLGTLNRDVSVTVPGKTFGSILEREDYDPTKHAVVTLSDLKHVLTRWVVDVYHQKTHRALECSPAQMWANSARIEDIPVIADPLRFDAILGGTANRTLTHKGIEYAGLLYNSPDMANLRQHLGERLEVDIRIDRSNLGSLIVLHPERGTPYRVTCLRADYAEGLTEWQHDVCKRYAREVLKADTNVDAWLESLLEISDIISQKLKLGKANKGPTSMRAARWNECKKPQEVPTPKQTTLQSDAAPVDLPPPASQQPQDFSRKRFAPVFEERGPRSL